MRKISMQQIDPQYIRIIGGVACVITLILFPVVLEMLGHSFYDEPIEHADTKENADAENEEEHLSYSTQGTQQDEYNQALAAIHVDPYSAHVQGKLQNTKARWVDGIPPWFLSEIGNLSDCEYAGYASSGNTAGFIRKGTMPETFAWVSSELGQKGWQCISSDTEAGHRLFGKDGKEEVPLHVEANEVGDCTCIVVCVDQYVRDERS